MDKSREKLIKEIKLLKSYFDDCREVLLCRNDVRDLIDLDLSFLDREQDPPKAEEQLERITAAKEPDVTKGQEEENKVKFGGTHLCQCGEMVRNGKECRGCRIIDLEQQLKDIKQSFEEASKTHFETAKRLKAIKARASEGRIDIDELDNIYAKYPFHKSSYGKRADEIREFLAKAISKMINKGE